MRLRKLIYTTLMESNGPNFRNALKALGLRGSEQIETQKNASDIVRAIITAYDGNVARGIAVVMTSNINDLVSQTHLDFSRGLPGMMIFTKDNDLEIEVDNTKLHLDRNDGTLLLVCSKGKKSLSNISNFLAAVGGKNYPVVIFDDEGDQASLDTHTRKRSQGVAVRPSPINNTIQNKLRPAVPKHVYVSVTGTPQAVLLQSADSSHKPSFIVMLPPGKSYVGGDKFFSTEEPE